MSWKFLVGASILSGGLLFKLGAPPASIVTGIAIAAALHWSKQRSRRRTLRGH